jgi:hypothetical protein
MRAGDASPPTNAAGRTASTLRITGGDNSGICDSLVKAHVDDRMVFRMPGLPANGGSRPGQGRCHSTNTLAAELRRDEVGNRD